MCNFTVDYTYFLFADYVEIKVHFANWIQFKDVQ